VRGTKRGTKRDTRTTRSTRLAASTGYSKRKHGARLLLEAAKQFMPAWQYPIMALKTSFDAAELPDFQ
jgi:hypothetical protein